MGWLRFAPYLGPIQLTEVSMARHLIAAPIAMALAVAAALPIALAAQAAPARSPYTVVKVCSLLTLAEVKAITPWAPVMDQFAAEEEAVGARGSSCNFPTADVQVLAWDKGLIESARKVRPFEAISGVGDEAWISNNRNMYTEVYARVGKHLLTVQYNIGPNETYESSKPKAIALLKAFAAKLR